MAWAAFRFRKTIFMKSENKECSRLANFPPTTRYKSASVVAVSLLATASLMAQDQGRPAMLADAGAPAPAAPGDAVSMPPPVLQAPKPTKNEVSVSGDVMLGSGTITVPLGYSLIKALGNNGGNLQPGTMSVARDSTYYGGTVSYSYGQAWYLDLSFAQGQSSGSQSIKTDSGSFHFGSINSSFSIDDTWYQAFVKYTFPQLRGKRLSAYLRAGASFVTADLKDDANTYQGVYTQKDTTQDLLGNLGGGLGYTVYSSSHLRFGLQAEIEAFYGIRSQDSSETLGQDTGLSPVTASIDNTLYGGIGRVTARVEYRLGQSGLFKIFAEVGAEGRYTIIEYPGAGSPTEMLWGLTPKSASVTPFNL